MRVCIAVLALSFAGSASAKDPTPIGAGQYMLSDQNFTIFGNADRIVAKLMRQAHDFCQSQNGQEAVMLQSAGSEAQPGQFNDNGQLRRGARGATGTIYFQCGAVEPTLSSQTDKYDALAKLKSLLDSGAITQEEYDVEKARILGQ